MKPETAGNTPEPISQLALEIRNLAYRGWEDRPNAKFLFREIGKRAQKIFERVAASSKEAKTECPGGDLCDGDLPGEWHEKSCPCYREEVDGVAAKEWEDRRPALHAKFEKFRAIWRKRAEEAEAREQHAYDAGARSSQGPVREDGVYHKFIARVREEEKTQAPQGPAREETPQWIRESKPQSAATMALGIINDLLGRNGPRGATQLLMARLSAWEEAIVGKTLADAGARSVVVALQTRPDKGYLIAADELVASRTSWLKQHGVPISTEFVRFAEAIGDAVEMLQDAAKLAGVAALHTENCGKPVQLGGLPSPLPCTLKPGHVGHCDPWNYTHSAGAAALPSIIFTQGGSSGNWPTGAPAENTTTRTPCGVQDHADAAQIVGGSSVPSSEETKEAKQ